MIGPLGLALLLGPAYATVKDPGVDDSIRWPSASVTVVVQEDGSADIDDGADFAAVQDSLAAWTAACSEFAFVYGGTVSGGANSNDGVNRIAWRESNWPGGMNGAGATTTRRRDTSADPDEWSDIDVLLNGVDFTWSTDGHPQRHDIQHIVTHELGHVLGLQHSSSPTATMYFGARAGHTWGRTLAPDDEAGLCHLYPAAGHTCSTDADCPLLDAFYGGQNAQTRCSTSSGVCEVGAADYGADCLSPSHCSSGLCAADPRNGNGDDPGFCTTGCDLGAQDCPNGDLCDDAAGTPLCLVGRIDCVFDGDCGGANDVCPADIDGSYRCRHLCLLDEHCSSAGGRCHGGTGENPPGFCREPGATADGQGCTDPYTCASLTCAGAGANPTCSADPTPPPVTTDGGPGPDPDPQPAPQPDPQPTPQPDPQPTPQPDPQPTPQPDPQLTDAGTADGGADPGQAFCRCMDAGGAEPSEGLLGLMIGLTAWAGRTPRPRRARRKRT